MQIEFDNKIINKIKFHIKSNEKLNILSINKIINIKISSNQVFNYIINFEKTNNIRRINKFHQSVNAKLNKGDLYISCIETLEQRSFKLNNKYSWIPLNIITLTDFLINRTIPKLPYIKKIYFLITKGKKRAISKTEGLGRLIACGFEILDFYEYKNLLYIVSKKKQAPDFSTHPSYGLLFKMRRVGYKGKIIFVYKFRTMYPFSEYCQDLIIDKNNLDKSGKILNDYRITKWGKFLRRFWLDEIPMLINFFKRDLNLIGVRPLSKSYYKRYPDYLQELRIKTKPGLLPPYYADLPKNFDEILLSEKKYIETKIKSPIKTDIKYFFIIIWNILVKGARSK